MSKYGKRAAGLLLTGVLCAGLLAGCGGAPEAAVTPTAPSESGSASGRRVETLRLEGGTDWGVPNPYLHQSRGPGTAKMRLVYGSLLEKDETGDVPWLAERWSMDGNDYTFTLFADAQFQDGAPLTTADVAFTLDTHGPDYLDTQEGRKLPVPHCLLNSEGWQLYGQTGQAMERSRDMVIGKGAFPSLWLANWLKEQGYDRVELAGLVSYLCVLSNAIMVKAALPEAEIVVDASCTAGPDPDLHAKGLDVMEALQITVLNR